jgi:hypothetical protein
MTAIAAQTEIPPASAIRPDAGRPFEEVLEEVRERDNLALADQIVPIVQLRATDDGFIHVPELGALALSPWSRRQLATMLGVRWDTWFRSEAVVPADRALEINRRLRASSGLLKIRARRYSSSEEVKGEALLRAFVTPTYEPIGDLEVFMALGQTLAGRLDSFRFVRVDVTAESSQYAAASLDEIDFGLDRPDYHRNGFIVANSDVGSRSLIVWAWIWRLKCSNGLVAPDSAVFRMIHRRRKEVSLHERLARGLGLIPEHWSRSRTLVRATRSERVVDVKATLEMVAKGDRDLRPISDSVLAAYDVEPEPTRFGLVQAVTRVAQVLTPERRLAVEEYAGQLMVRLPQPEPRS